MKEHCPEVAKVNVARGFVTFFKDYEFGDPEF